MRHSVIPMRPTGDFTDEGWIAATEPLRANEVAALRLADRHGWHLVSSAVWPELRLVRIATGSIRAARMSLVGEDRQAPDPRWVVQALRTPRPLLALAARYVARTQELGVLDAAEVAAVDPATNLLELALLTADSW